MSENITNIKTSATDKARRFNWPRIFGYDFFISFKLGPPPIGAQSYASDLARRLRELDFTVFYSEEEAPPGEKLDTTLLKALHHSRILVILANQGALVQSQWVRKEVEEFRRKHPKRPVIPINIDRAIEKYGAQAGASEWLKLDGRIWLDETSQAVDEGITSLEVLNRLGVAPRFIRSNTRFRWMIVTVILMLIGLTFWAGYEGWDATKKFHYATSLKLVAQAQGMSAGNLVGGDVRAYRLLLAAWQLSKSDEVKSALLQAMVPSIGKYSVLGPITSINAVAYSPDGLRIVSGNMGNTLRLWDAKTGLPISDLLRGHENNVTSVSFSKDGKYIVSGSADGTLRLWDAKTGIPFGQSLQGHEAAVTSVAFSPDCMQIVSGSQDKTLRIWGVNSRVSSQLFRGHDDGVTSVAFSPDGKRIVSGSEDMTLRIWDVTTGKILGQPLQGHKGVVTSIAISPDGTKIVSGSFDMSLQLWNAETGKIIGQPLLGHKGVISSVAFSPDGKRLASGSWDSTVRLWDAVNGVAIGRPFEGHEDKVTDVAFSPDGANIVSGSWDGTLRLWGGKNEITFQDNENSITSLALSPDSNRLVMGSADKTLQLLDLTTGKQIGQKLRGHKDIVSAVAFSPDGKRLVSGSWDNTLRLWDAVNGVAIGRPFEGHEDKVWSAAFSPNGTQIVSVSADNTLRLWKADDTGASIGIFHASCNKDETANVAFSPDGTHLVSGCGPNKLQIWDVDAAFSSSETVAVLPICKPIDSAKKCLSILDANTGKNIGLVLKGHKEPVLSATFSPDGKRIVSGGKDKTLRVWDVDTGGAIGQALYGHGDVVTTVSFSPDGKYIVSGSKDKTIRLWNTQTLAPIGPPLKGHKAKINSVLFSPDGRLIVSGSSDNLVRFWPAPKIWADELCKKLPRNMSYKEWREWVSPDIDYIEQCPGLPIPPDESEVTTSAVEATQP